jgi:Flp pilus assembly protein CpaB
MSRRGRAAAFATVALACAVVAALVADSYGTSVASQYGALRPVVVAARDLPDGELLDARDAGRLLEMRRVPSSFVPPGALMSVGDAIGRATAAPLPAGAYLLTSLLEVPRRRRGDAEEPAIADGLRPVEIAVTGAEALSASGRPPQDARVDVVVTTEPDVGDDGRTYVAAEAVELLALAAGGGSADDGLGEPMQIATLALTRAQALRLIEAENFARQVRLIAHVE